MMPLATLSFAALALQAKRPNIVLFLQDDQDYALGGWDPMSQATELLSQRGATGELPRSGGHGTQGARRRSRRASQPPTGSSTHPCKALAARKLPRRALVVIHQPPTMAAAQVLPVTRRAAERALCPQCRGRHAEGVPLPDATPFLRCARGGRGG